MSPSSLRIGLGGAAGALGREIVEMLDDSGVSLAELLPFTTERSAGPEIELAGDVWPIASEMPALRGLDGLILATPIDVARELAREALRAETPCLDAAGAFADVAEVPMLGIDDEELLRTAPLVTLPPGPALGLLRVLRALDQESPIEALSVTLLLGASVAGQGGIEALSQETIALLGTLESPEPGVFVEPVAFDVWPDAGSLGGEATAALESRVAAVVRRALARDALAIEVTAVLVPAFVGCGALVSLVTETAIAPALAGERLAKVPELELRAPGEPGPSLRESAGSSAVKVGQLRVDRSRGERGLQLFVSADPLRLAAVEAVRWLVRRGAH